MSDKKVEGMAVYVVTKIFRAEDGTMRVPGDPDPKRGTVTVDYSGAARLRAAGCIGGIVPGVIAAKPKKRGPKKVTA